MDWWVFRIVASKHFAADAERVRYEWSFHTQVEAHRALDALDDIDDIYRPDPRKKR